MNAEAFEVPPGGGKGEVRGGRSGRGGAMAGARKIARRIGHMAGASLLVAGLLAAVSTTSAAADDWVPELVSPQRSGGLNIFVSWGAANGENAFFYNDAITSGVFVSGRTSSGWDNLFLEQRQANVMPHFQDSSPDFLRVIVKEETPIKAGSNIYKEGIYLHDGDSVITVAAWDEYIGRPGSWKPATYLGGSEDKRTLFLHAFDGVLDADPTETSLYRWVDGAVEPIVISDQRFLDCPAEALIGGMVAASSNVSRRVTSLMQTGISADGETYVVAPRACSVGGDQYPTHLYLVKDGAAPIDITKPVAGDDAASTFLGMSPDGARIFLTTTARLTADDTDTNGDVYMWENGSLTRLSADPALEDLIVGSTMVSPDGGTVWMVARTATSPFSYEMFTWRDGVVRSITTLRGNILFAGEDNKNPTQVSYDGSALLVRVNPNIVGTPPTGPIQIFRFAIDGEVTCVSCTADGSAVAAAALSSEEPMFQKTGWPDPRISADGSTIAFETAAVLVPQDTNEKVDVYVWRDGVHELISSGTVNENAIATGLSWDGRTAFFKSWGAIVPGSTDPYRKLYAARLGGGFPPPPALGACGADCQGPVTPGPALPVIGSVSFGGDGNASAEPQSPRATVRVARLRPVTGARARLRVRVSAAGRVAVSGPGIRRYARQAPRAGIFNLRVALNPKARKRLVRNKKLNVRARVVYRARGGGRAVQRVAVTFRQPNASRTGRKGGR